MLVFWNSTVRMPWTQVVERAPDNRKVVNSNPDTAIHCHPKFEGGVLPRVPGGHSVEGSCELADWYQAVLEPLFKEARKIPAKKSSDGSNRSWTLCTDV